MPDSSEINIDKLSPDKLLTRFNQSGTALCIILAFALHVVVLGGTSVDYIHGIVSPAWKEKQDQLKEAAAREKAEAERRQRKARSMTVSSGARSRPATRPASTAPTTKPKPPAGGRRLPKKVTTMPKTGEIPKLPGAGIGIDETEGR